MKKGSSCLYMRQAQDIWLITQSHGVSIKLKKESKTYENEITTWYIQGSPKGNGQHKFQEEYETLAQGHGGTKKGFPHPKGEMSAWAPNAIKDLTRAPMYGKSLPFT